jgi:hypothetical protein
VGQEQRAAREQARAERALKRSRPIYFVYLLLDGDLPFYVGCSNSNNRLAGHLYEAQNGLPSPQNPKNTVIRRILGEGRKLAWRKIAEGLTRAEALKLEDETILASHRSGAYAPLVNKLGRSETALLRDRIAVLEIENEQLRSALAQRDARAAA